MHYCPTPQLIRARQVGQTSVRGPHNRRLVRSWIIEGDACCEVLIPSDKALGRYNHVGLLDFHIHEAVWADGFKDQR